MILGANSKGVWVSKFRQSEDNFNSMARLRRQIEIGGEESEIEAKSEKRVRRTGFRGSYGINWREGKQGINVKHENG
jgi:hypothetical protein